MYLLKSSYSILMLAICLFSQEVAQAQYTGVPFSVDVISVKADVNQTESRLDVYTSLPYSSLRFLKEGSAFIASYQVEAEVFAFEKGSRNPVLKQKEIWNASVSVSDFASTQSIKQIDYSSESFFLPSGRYLVKINIQDKATDVVYETELITEVRDFTGGISVSDLMLVNDYSLASNSISPVVSNRVFSDDARFKVFYELYATYESPVNVQFELIRTQRSRGLPFLRWFFRRGQAAEDSGEITYRTDQSLQLSEGRLPSLLEIPLSGFEVGEYRLRVRVEDEQGETLDIAERSITLEFSDRAEYQGRDIDAAIAQLKYIAKPKELKEIRSAKTKQDRQERFLAFWEKRDPTPGTPENESMEEYYLRIDFANRHYSGLNSGWETDRGLTLVLYGEPDEVDRNALDAEFSQPYEVWYYNRIGLRFIFLDRGGVGNFELITPKWAERSVIR